MSEKPKLPTIRKDVAELLQLFGPPPLLPTENFAAYVELVGRLLDSVVYPDPMVKLLVKEVADPTFEAARIARHKILVMHRRIDDRLKYQVLRSKESAEGKEGEDVAGNRLTLRQVSDKIIEATANEVSETQVAAPPIASDER